MHGSLVGSIDLLHIMAATFELVDLLVAEPFGHALQLRMLAEEMFTVVTAVFGGEGLELSIDGPRQNAL
ncbi:hypothetical protein D3C86_2175540 [compost metagenome]